jgi:hypothetical protein
LKLQCHRILLFGNQQKQVFAILDHVCLSISLHQNTSLDEFRTDFTVQLWVFEIRLAKAFMQYTTSALGLADDVA